MSLTDQIGALATRVADEINDVRTEIGSGGTPIDLPSYASGLTHNWQPEKSAYNVRSANQHSWRAQCAKASVAARELNVLFVGDSTLIGYNGTSYHLDDSIPRQFGKRLAKALGGIEFCSGHRFGTVATDNSHDDTWTLTGTWAGAAPVTYNTGATGTATWKSLDIGTTVEIIMDKASTTGMTWSIDGVTQTAITSPGGSGAFKVTVTGLANTQHTVVLNAASGKSFYVYSLRVGNGGNGVVVHNLAVGGAKANSGTPNGANWSSTVATFGSAGLGYMAEQVVTAAGFTVDLLVICVGNNDALAGIAAATILTGVGNIAGYWSSAPVLLVHPPKVTGTSDTIFDALNAGFYTTADTLNAAYFDWNDFAGSLTGYTADGVAGADGIHPIAAEQRRIGWALAGMMLANDLQGGFYSIKETAGAYPPRPNVAPGQVNYIGADEPTDWLEGDTWDDTS